MALTSPSDPAGSFFCFVIVLVFAFFFFLSLLFCKATLRHPPPPAPPPRSAPGARRPPQSPALPPLRAGEGGGAASPVALAPEPGFGASPTPAEKGGNRCGKPAVSPGGGGAARRSAAAGCGEGSRRRRPFFPRAGARGAPRRCRALAPPLPGGRTTARSGPAGRGRALDSKVPFDFVCIAFI